MCLDMVPLWAIRDWSKHVPKVQYPSLNRYTCLHMPGIMWDGLNERIEPNSESVSAKSLKLVARKLC